MADLGHFCEFIEFNMHPGAVKVSSDYSFLLYIDQNYPFLSLHKVLTILMVHGIDRGELELIQWTPNMVL
jgi:hypothetical protein